jgi:hypothetical protein
MSNCLIFALMLAWRRRGRRGYFAIRRSDHSWFPHFLWIERHHIISYKPLEPEDRKVPPALFEGRVRWGDKHNRDSMVQPLPRIVEDLTGSVRARPSWFGKYVFQVEVKQTSHPAFAYAMGDMSRPIASWSVWRDATWQDLQALPKIATGAGLPKDGE